MKRTEQRRLERAARTITLKDHGATAIDARGNVMEGYFRLRDNRIIKLSELEDLAQAKKEQWAPNTLGYDPEAVAANHPELKNMSGIGLDKDGNAKKGFYKTAAGKVVSINKLNAIVNAIDTQTESASTAD